MTTPSSLEELRESVEQQLVLWGLPYTAPIVDSFVEIFRSHMEAVIEDLIGEKEYYREHYPFVVTQEQHIEMKERLARDELRHGMRKRAKSYLEGEK